MKRTGYAMLSVLLAATAGLAAPASAPSSRQIFNDADPNFILNLPNDFKECPRQSAPANMLFFWGQYDKPDHKTDVYVEIDRVQELPQAPIEKPANVEKMYTEKWQGWDISVYLIRTTRKNEKNVEQVMITRNAAVPLKGSALKLQVTGPEADDAQMDALLKDLLAGLQGQTNWTTPEDHTLRTLLCAGGLIVALAAIAAVLLFRQRQWNKRRQLSAAAAMHMPKSK